MTRNDPKGTGPKVSKNDPKGTVPKVSPKVSKRVIGVVKERKVKSFSAEGIRDFDLDHIFQCGQCFRWEKQADGTYAGVAKKRIVNVRYDAERPGATDAGRLTITPCSEEEFETVWRPYFDLDRDYGKIKETLSRDDDIMEKAVKYGYGIRLLKQDLWETIVSFIISQNNNIPRIKGCIERLCDNFGEPLTEGAAGGPVPHDIPEPEALASLTEEDLAPVRLGYRAKYLIETSRTVCEKGLPEDFDDLSSLCGVGPKVASCISLFGMQDYSSFPIDVWVMRVMHELYGLDEKNKKAMAEFARERFGDLGGFAQQYLFYYMRDRS